MRRILLLALLLITAFGARAQFWTQGNGPFGGDVRELVYNPGTSTVYAAVCGGRASIYKSTDNGATWTELLYGDDPNDGGCTFDIEIDATGNLYVINYWTHKLFKSTDGGATWTSSALPALPANTYGEYIKVEKSFSGALFVTRRYYDNSIPTYRFSVHRSTDNGTTWTDSYTSTVVTTNWYENGMALAASPSANTLFIGVPEEGIRRSLDGGTTWSLLEGGITYSGLKRISSMAYNSNNSLLAAVVGSGLHYFNGTNWTRVTSIDAYKTPGSFDIYDQAIPSHLTNTFYLMDVNNGQIIFSPVAPFTAAWTLIPDPATTYVARGLTVTNSTANLVYGGYDHLFRTSTTGSTWTESFTGMARASFEDMIVTAGRVVVSTPGRIQMSADRGLSWVTTQPQGAGTIGDLAIYNSGAIITAQGRSSSDNGSTWTQIAGWPGYFYRHQAGVSSNAYGVSYTCSPSCGYYIYKSTNDGLGWTQLSIGGLPSGWYLPTWQGEIFDVSTTAVSGTPANSLYFILYNNGTGKSELWKLSNGAVTATQVTSFGAVNSIYNIIEQSGKLYLVVNTSSGDRLMISSDAGATWPTVRNIPSADRFTVATNGFFFVGGTSNYHYSKDDGVTWINEDMDPDFYATVRSSAIAPDGYLYALADNFSIFRSSSPILPPTNAPVTSVAGTGVIGYNSNQVDIRWTYTTGTVPPSEFVILRSGDAGVTFDTVSVVSYNVGQTAYIFEDYSASPSSSYIYRVAAANAGGSNTSSNVNVTTLADCSSSIPNNRSWTATGGAVTNAAVSVLLSGDAQFGNFRVSDITSSATPYIAYFVEECNSTNLYYDGTYWNNSNGVWNGVNQFTLRYTDGVTSRVVTYTLNAFDPIPPVPSAPEVYVANGSTMLVRFYGNYWETSFDIERATALGGPYSVVANVPWSQEGYDDGFDYFDQIASPVVGTTYYYRVKAKNASGASAATASTSVILSNPAFGAMQDALWTTPSGYGSSFGDFNKDGFEDIALSYYSTLHSPQIFRNVGGASLVSLYQATDITTSSSPAYFRGTFAADFNNDGNLDLFSPESFSGTVVPSWAILGNGTGGFTQITGNPILDIEPSWGASAADFDNDGRIDIYFNSVYDDVADSYTSKLYRNAGSNNFTLVPGGPVGDQVQSSRVSIWSDYDNDNDQDVFVASAFTSPNLMYRNNGDNTFSAVQGTALDLDVSRSTTRTASWGDFNDDSYLDLFVGNTGATEDWLYQNDQAGGFIKVAVPALSTAPSNHSTYASAWGDLDNDGRLDLAIMRSSGLLLLHNDGNGLFSSFIPPITELYGQPMIFGGLSLADMNNDGLLDLTIVHNSGSLPNGVYMNNGSWFSGGSNRWLKVKLRGSVSNGAAVGALVEITDTGLSKYREVATVTGFCSGNSLIQHFGLGGVNQVDEIKVYWPSGLTTTLTNQNTNQLIEIFEDGTAPVITHSSSNRDNGSNYTVTATVTDSSPLSDVYVAWKGIRELDDVSNYEGATMVQGAGNTWTYAVPSGKYDEIGIEYYIGATDAAGNFDEVGPYFSRTRYPGENDLELSGLRSGGRADTWKLIGIPYDLGNKTVSSVFDELGPYDKNVWRMVTYKDQTSWQELSGTTLLERGKGYFLNMVNATAVKFGNATTPNNDLSNEHRIAVKSGWNMISNPYPFNLNWDEVLCYNGISSGMDLQSYNGGYIPASSLGIFDGGLFFSSAGSAIDFPLTLAGTGCRIERVNASDISQSAWKLRLHLKNSSVQYGIGGIGMHPEASPGADRFDQYTPPRFDDFLEVGFDSESLPGERTTLDFAPTSEAYVWSFVVDAATEGATEMTWNHLELGENTVPMYLYDKTSQKVVDMRVSGSYSFIMGKSRSFEIHFGKEVVPDRVVLGEAWPNPTNASATIPFALPETSVGGYQVAVEVYNTLGVRVKLVGEGLFQAGFHEMTWDGQDSSSEAVKPGMYLYRLKVSQNGETQTITSRIIRK